jgi:hypothetical protein
MKPESPLSRPAVFYYLKRKAFVFYGYKGPLVFRSRITTKMILDFYAMRTNSAPSVDTLKVALEKFDELYLQRSVKVLGEI